MPQFETISYAAADGVAWVTLNRPEVMNAFDTRMQRELSGVWRRMRDDDDVRVAVLTAAGDKAFCTGVDRAETMRDDTSATAFLANPFHYDDPGRSLGPKSNELWKPVVAAVNGVACGGAFYLLGEADVLIAADHATFFDPHVSYGMPASYESMLMAGRMPLGEVLRMQLMGASERMSARRAHEIGLVSEVVPSADLRAAADHVARTIAASPTLAVQATLRATWKAAEQARLTAVTEGYAYVALGMTKDSLAQGQQRFAGGERLPWRLR